MLAAAAECEVMCVGSGVSVRKFVLAAACVMSVPLRV